MPNHGATDEGGWYSLASLVRRYAEKNMRDKNMPNHGATDEGGWYLSNTVHFTQIKSSLSGGAWPLLPLTFFLQRRICLRTEKALTVSSTSSSPKTIEELKKPKPVD